MHDDDLVRAARSGDQVAFAGLVERHRRDALRVAYGIADGEADDVAQDAFLKAYRALGTFRDGGSFRAWLLAIVANEARNRRRSFLRRRALQLRVRDAVTVGDGFVADDAADIAERHERRAAVVAALAKLPDRDREVISLRYFAGLSEAEMAAGLACAPGTVKSRLARALARLEHELAGGAP